MAIEMTRNDLRSDADTLFSTASAHSAPRRSDITDGSREPKTSTGSKVSLDDLPSGLTQEDDLARFHVATTKGELMSGGNAFSIFSRRFWNRDTEYFCLVAPAATLHAKNTQESWKQPGS